MTRSRSRRSLSLIPRPGTYRNRPVLEALEPRLCLATSQTIAAGIDALAMGDVNGDQVVDIAVARHQGRHQLVTIYSGWGKPAATTTGFAALPLVTLVDPLGLGSGPLDVALGDFTGDGVSDLAVAATSSHGRAPKIEVWSFQITAASPVNSPVNPVVLSGPFTPAGMSGATGFHLAAADLTGLGRDQLIVAPGGPGQHAIEALAYNTASSTWSVARTISDVPVCMKLGLSISAGDLTNDGAPDLVVGSKASGRVSVYDGALGQWVWTTSPLGKGAQDIRVAVVSGEGNTGAFVATSFTKQGGPRVAVVPYQGVASKDVQLVKSPGAGALVPLGGGYVYQRSTVQNPQSQFPTSNGPVTPTVLFGATGGDKLVIQGFKTQTVPSPLDVYVEPLWKPSTAGFTPLQPEQDPSATGQKHDSSSIDSIPINLVALPKIVYHSPYEIQLPPVSGVTPFNQGLLPYTSVETTPQGGWGPQKVPNVPPTVPSTLSAAQAADWLRERVISAYASFLGVDYQHHHDPSWQPEQGSPWEITATVAYQSQGIDCTNYTAYAYADALGISMNSDTATQALISPQDLQGTVIPTSMLPYIQFQTITKWSSYNDLISQLEPGDILYIDGNPSNPTQTTHAITWLGQYGVDAATGQMVPLVIDSTGITPPHIDSNNHVVPEGVQIRPFGDANSPNSWYFTHLDHVLRIIAN